MEKYFLRIDGDKFGFVVDGIHDIKEADIELKTEEYSMFFELQGQGKQFRLKEEPTGTGLFDLIEEFIPEVDNSPQPPTTEERLASLEEAMLAMLELNV